MDLSALPLALLLAAFLAAGVLTAVLRKRRRKSTPDWIGAEEAQSMLSVMEAATRAYEAAKREGMVIAWVAENARDPDGPAGWFARNIVGVVASYRKSDRGFEKTPGVGTEPQSLYIRKQDYRTYIDWARGMQ